MKEVSVTQIGEFPVNFFFQAISIYLRKGQVVNRKLSCTSNLAFFKLDSTCLDEIKTNVIRKLQDVDITQPDDVKRILQDAGIECTESSIDELKHFDGSEGATFISVDRMIPRNLKIFKTCLLASFIDTNDTSITFYPIGDSNKLLPSVVHKISYSDSKHLSLSAGETSTDESTNWLQFVLLKKLQSWIENCEKEESNETIESHQLIDSELYNQTYAELKEKYGKSLEENWKESTDPKKFIYEDIAIASYLIVLWKLERQSDDKLQSFVDLGCGNGLLVYILTQEGHLGYGIDLRKRNIWDQFPSTTDLREMAIIPSDENLFPDVDWVIGNHSDELSPWVPVISARSSYKSKYFLLPCCSFEFSGAKFQRKGSKSQYLSFIDYLKVISNVCGFEEAKLDRLKIPSTKRICLVGTTRTINENEFHEQCRKIQNFINEASSQAKPENQSWSESFKPREKYQSVKNCSQVDRRLTEAIAKRIFISLLERKETFSDDFPEWNAGGAMKLPEAVELVSADELKKLKSECGGLQTLLRNKHQIFHVVGGYVKIRIPRKVSEMVFSQNSTKRNVIKSSPCYFFQNHPSSCPLDDKDCSYIH